MADEQISLPYLAVIFIISGLIIRYLFFSGPPVPRSTRPAEAFLRSREVAVERIQQMFPQAERRSILWDLQRNGGNVQNTTERILAGRLETVSHHCLDAAHISRRTANGTNSPPSPFNRHLRRAKQRAAPVPRLRRDTPRSQGSQT